MRRILLASSAALALTIAPLSAQGRVASCPVGTIQQRATADACEKAIDIFNYMMPQLGTSLAGGSHTLGIGSTLGGFPHLALALRGNAVFGDLPDINGIAVSPTGPTRSNIATNSQMLGLPGVDFALGLYKGFPLGVSRVGGVDLIGSLTYVPDIENAGVSITTSSGSVKVGLGVRVGILEQSVVVPGVAFSYLRRDVPTLALTASSGNDTFLLDNFDVKTTSWRIAAQKNLMLFQLGAGVGQDTYESAADITVTVRDPIIPGGSASTSASPDQSLTRTTMYGSVGINLFLAKLVAEVGRVSGGNVEMYNTFAEEADKARLYGSFGIRISF